MKQAPAIRWRGGDPILSIRWLFFSLALAVAIGAIQPQARAETPANFLVIADRTDGIRSLDPHDAQTAAGAALLRNLYDGLVAPGPGGPVPQIAETWEVSEDGRTFTFRIRAGMTFTSGNPVIAQTVVYSLRRAVLRGGPAAYTLTDLGLNAENLAETLIAPDDATFQLVTDIAYAPEMVLGALSAPVSLILDAAALSRRAARGDPNWLRRNVAGSGAYRLVSWKPGQGYILDANTEYWRGAGPLERILVRPAPDSAVMRALLQRGDIDIARGLKDEDVAALRADPAVAVGEAPQGHLIYLALNQANPVLAKPQVREALRYLVDYQGLARNGAEIHQSFLLPGQRWALAEASYALDAEKAATLLAEAGEGQGFEASLLVGDDPRHQAIAEDLQLSFAAAGIGLTLVVRTAAEADQSFQTGDFDIALRSYAPAYPDPHSGASSFASNPGDASGRLAARVGWDPAELGAETEVAGREFDPNIRGPFYLALQQAWQRSAPFVAMLHLTDRVAWRQGIQNAVSERFWEISK